MVRLRGGTSSLADTLAILAPTPPPAFAGLFDWLFSVFAVVRLRGGTSSLADTLVILAPTPPPASTVVFGCWIVLVRFFDQGDALGGDRTFLADRPDALAGLRLEPDG